MPIARLSSKSQIVIPAEMRRKLGINPGDNLLLEAEGDRIVLSKASGSPLERLAAFRGDQWRGYADEVQRSRDEWER